MKATNTNTTPQANDAQSSSGTLNKLRAAVLGANDGIVSTSSVVMGVAGATNDRGAIFTAGMAALVAGALSMAVGEYISVSSQSDAEKAYIEKEREELLNDPEGEFEELVASYETKGISPTTARLLAEELTEHDALKAHLQEEFRLDEKDISSPTQAAVASLLSFAVGGIIPFMTIILAPDNLRILFTLVAVIIALGITGYTSAYIGNASRKHAITRVLIGGVLAMLITYAVGRMFGVAVS